MTFSVRFGITAGFLLGMLVFSDPDVRSRSPEIIIRFDRIIGHEGVGPGEMIRPSGVDVDPSGHVYIADTGNHRAQLFSPDGLFIRVNSGSGVTGSGLTDLMAIEATGLDVYATDSRNRRVIRFDRHLDYVGALPAHSQETRIGHPWGVAASGDGAIYIADTENEEILKMDTSGRMDTRFGGFSHGAGRLHRPAGLAIDAQGLIYVADTQNNRIAVFDAYGGFLRSIGDGELSAPEGVDVDNKGRVFIADTGHHRIVVYSEEGQPLTHLGTEGQGPASFRLPGDVAVWGDSLLYVADTGNHRIQRFIVE